MFQELPLLEHSNEEISIQTVKVLKSGLMIQFV